MLILAVDTSSRMGSAAILNDSELLAEVCGYEETPYSSRLFRDISQLEARTGIRMDQIELFAVAAGPGSFTGLRVGLTAAKAWSEVHGKPIAPVSGLEAVAAQAVLSGTNNPLVPPLLAPFLDARRGQVFGAIYRRLPGDSLGLVLEGDEAILAPHEFLELVKAKSSSSVELVSPAPETIPAARVKEILPAARVTQVSASLAPIIGRLGFEKAKCGILVDSIGLDANYVRRSDAEAAWKDG